VEHLSGVRQYSAEQEEETQEAIQWTINL
jgi:hypothetical protein